MLGPHAELFHNACTIVIILFTFMIIMIKMIIMVLNVLSIASFHVSNGCVRCRFLCMA